MQNSHCAQTKTNLLPVLKVTFECHSMWSIAVGHSFHIDPKLSIRVANRIANHVIMLTDKFYFDTIFTLDEWISNLFIPLYRLYALPLPDLSMNLRAGVNQRLTRQISLVREAIYLKLNYLLLVKASASSLQLVSKS